jgi:hypothetical protein
MNMIILILIGICVYYLYLSDIIVDCIIADVFNISDDHLFNFNGQIKLNQFMIEFIRI